MKSNRMQCYFVGHIKVRAIADRSAPHMCASPYCPSPLIRTPSDWVLHTTGCASVVGEGL
jgi:hypothetical protein